MKILAFKNSYISKNGNPTYVHTFSCTQEEETVLTEKGSIFRTTEDGMKICFLQDKFPTGTNLAVSNSGKIYAQTELLTKRVSNKVDAIKAFMAVGFSQEKIAALAFGGATEE
jgi:hypothetical protein